MRTYGVPAAAPSRRKTAARPARAARATGSRDTRLVSASRTTAALAVPNAAMINLGTGERGERQRQPRRRRFGRISHRHDAPRRLLQGPMTRKERAHVTVGADAKQHHIESGRSADCLPELGFVQPCRGVQICGIRLHAMNARPIDRHAAQQQLVGHAIVRVLVVRSNGALVAPEHLHHRPVDRGQRQDRKERLRHGPAGQNERQGTACGLHALSRARHTRRKGAGELDRRGNNRLDGQADAMYYGELVVKCKKPFLSPTSLTPAAHAPRVRPPCEYFSQRQPSRRQLADALHPSRRESCARGHARRRGKGWRVCLFPFLRQFLYALSYCRSAFSSPASPRGRSSPISPTWRTSIPRPASTSSRPISMPWQ